MGEQVIDRKLALALYENALEGGDWRPALDGLRTMLRSSEATLALLEQGRTPAVETTRNFLTVEACNDYIEHYWQIDPKNDYFSRAPAGFVFNDARHFDEGFVKRNPFYQEYSIPLGSRHTLDLLARTGTGRITFLAVMRSNRQGLYYEADENLLRGLSRSFLKVLAVREKLSAAEDAARLATGVLEQLSMGVLVLDAGGRVVLANGAALEICGSGGGLRICRDRLVARSLAETAQIEAAVRQAGGIDDPVQAIRIGQCDGEALLAWIAPLPVSSPLNPCSGRCVLVILANSRQQSAVLPEHLKRLYGLTQAEAELATLLAGGTTLADAARRRRIKLSTARTQLLAVLQKLGVHRQSDLARLVARLPGALLLPTRRAGES